MVSTVSIWTAGEYIRLANRATADVFASGDRLEDVAARWVSRFNEHEARAVAELVNLVLRAAGCDLRIDEDDIADPDNAPSRVAEIQEEFQTVSMLPKG
jgi:cohesin complex subunit SA-1/2